MIAQLLENNLLSKRSARGIGAATVVLSTIVGALELSSQADEQKNSPTQKKVFTEKTSEPRTIAIRVLDVAGRPLSQANVLVNASEVEPGNVSTQNYSTNDEGKVDIAIPRRLRGLRIWPSKTGYVSQFVNFAEGTHEDGQLIPDEIEFQLQTGQRLSGLVADTDGNPIPDAKVQVKVEVEEPIWGANPEPIISTWLANGGGAAVTDKDGRWEINNAPAPMERSDFEFRLQVTHPEFVGDKEWGELQEQQGITTKALRAGTAKLTMAQGIPIAGSIKGPDGTPVTQGLVVWDEQPDRLTRIMHKSSAS